MAKERKNVDLSKYGAEAEKALAQHAKDPVQYGIINLPPGINNGIAKLEECYFAEYEKDSQAMGTKKGDVYIRMSAVIVEPEYVGQVKVAGLRTSVNMPYCPTKSKTLAENVAKIQNELKKIVPDADVSTSAKVKAVAAALEKAGPYILFSTSVRPGQVNPQTGEKSPDGVWENWHGTRGLENYTPGKPGGGMTDSTDAVSAEAEAAADAEAAAATNDVSELLAAAEGGNSDAQDKLKEIAKGRGWGDAELDDALNWSDVAAMAGRDKEADGPRLAETPDEGSRSAPSYEPKEGDTVNYAPPGKKAGTKLKPVECKVVKVGSKNKTVSLVSARDAKVKFDGVKWDDVEAA